MLLTSNIISSNSSSSGSLDLTVTLQVSTLPLLDLTVIVQDPIALATTTPSTTLATFSFELCQVKSLLTASLGSIVTSNSYSSSTSSSRDFLSSVTLSTTALLPSTWIFNL